MGFIVNRILPDHVDISKYMVRWDDLSRLSLNPHYYIYSFNSKESSLMNKKIGSIFNAILID